MFTLFGRLVGDFGHLLNRPENATLFAAERGTAGWWPRTNAVTAMLPGIPLM